MIKRKHFLVIMFSSMIVGIVLVSTIVGYSLYIEWKNNSFAIRYNNSISKLTAEMFKDDVGISNVKAGAEEGGIFSGMPIIEGSIKNNTNKTITSITMEISFLQPDGFVVYRDRFHPIGDERFVQAAALTTIEHTKNILLPGESISFKHLLRNCPPEVMEKFSSKAKFAKTTAESKIKLDYSISGMTVL